MKPAEPTYLVDSVRLPWRMRLLVRVLRLANWWIRRRLTPEQRKKTDEIAAELQRQFLEGDGPELCEHGLYDWMCRRCTASEQA